MRQFSIKKKDKRGYQIEDLGTSKKQPMEKAKN
jgi:hypothetical protein